jgi:hypothetical protein
LVLEKEKGTRAIGDKRSTAKVQPVDPHSGDRGSAAFLARILFGGRHMKLREGKKYK